MALVYLVHALTLPAHAGAPLDLTRLEQLATHSLESNLITPAERAQVADTAMGGTATLPLPRYLVAGGLQFKSLWTRDFAYASRALLLIDESGVVADQLDLLLRYSRPVELPPGRPAARLVPRVIDSEVTQWRVVLGSFGIELPLSADLKPEYTDEHGSEAIDSNLLVLRAALFYLRASGDTVWWASHEERLVAIYRYYDHKFRNDLIEQPAFSDWQDSVERTGATFYTNLLYWLVSRELEPLPAFAVDRARLTRLEDAVMRVFWVRERGLFRSLSGTGSAQPPQISLDAHLLLLDARVQFGPVPPRRLYQALRHSWLWRGGVGLPGFNTTPDYPTRSKSATVRLGGVAGYHDRAYWSWLMALSAKVAGEYLDPRERDRILTTLATLAERDGGIAEIYAPTPGLPRWQSPLYRAEYPFSWGAGVVIEALRSRARMTRPSASNE